VKFHLLVLLCLCCSSLALALQRSEVLFYAPLDGRADAEIAAGSPAALPGLNPRFVDGRNGQALRTGRKSWATPELFPEPTMTFTMDIDIYKKYGDASTVGPLRYAATDNIRAEEGTLSFWMRPVNWKSGGRERFLANLGMQDTLALFYSPYWAYDMFENYEAPDRYTRALVGGGEFRTSVWEHVVIAWNSGLMTWWKNGVRMAKETSIVPLKNATGMLAFGDGSDDETDFDDILILSRAVTDEEARALYYRLARQEPRSRLTLGQGKERAVTLRGWNDRLLGVANADPTAARVWREADGLHVEFTYPIPDKYRADRATFLGVPLRYRAAADSLAIFEDDLVEVSVQTGEGAPTYRFVVNGANTAYDARDGEAGWNGAWRHAVDLNDDRWITTMVIPWSDLGGAPAAGTSWGFNLRHQTVHLDREDSVWAFTGAEQPMLGAIAFADQAPAITVAAAANPGGGTVTLRGNIAGQAGAAYTVTGTVTTTCANALDPDSRFAQKDHIAPDGWTAERQITGAGDFSLQTTLPGGVPGDLVLAVSDAQGNEIFRQRQPFAYAISWNVYLSPLPTMERLVVELDAGGEGPINAGLGAEIAFKDADGTVLATQTVKRMAAIREYAEFSLAGVMPGQYTVETVYQLDGRATPAIARTFTMPEKPAWLGTTIGISDKVPAPWSPVKRRGSTLDVWGRQYDFTRSLLPRRITVLGEQILAAPMRLRMVANGKDVTPTRASVLWTKQTDRRVDNTATARVGDLKIAASTWTEFDGFMWVTVKMSGHGQLDRLALEIPLKPEYATHWFSGEYVVINPSGYLPSEPYASAPRNAARFGSPDRGIQWCWESEQGWSLQHRDASFTLQPGTQAYVISQTFVDHPITIDGERTIQFGLQALPAKPHPHPGWRDIWWFGPWQKEPERPMRTTTQWNGEENWVMLHHNYPNQTDERIRQVREQVIRGLKQEQPHHHAYKHFDWHADANTPEYRLFGEEWRCWPWARPDFATVEGKPDAEIWASVCYNAQSYLDFYLYHTHRYLNAMRGPERLPVNIYIDCTGPVSCSNPYHGCGWVDDTGARRTTYTILAQRRYMQRLYQIFADMGEDTWITVHMSGNPLMAVWSYAHMIMPGEQFASFFQKERARMDAAGEPCHYSYIPYLRMDRFRAEFASTAYGVPQGFLQQLYCIWNTEDRQEMKRDPNALTTGKLKGYTDGLRHFSSMCIVHDTIPWGGTVEEQHAIRTKFKWDDSVRFHGYWANSDLVTFDIHDEQRYVLSLMTRPERFLLIAFNDTDAPVTGTATLNLEKLGFPQAADAELLDLLTDEKVAMQGNRVTFTIPPRRLRLLMYGAPWDWRTEVKQGTYTP
jgi:hypothetical protein